MKHRLIASLFHAAVLAGATGAALSPAPADAAQRRPSGTSPVLAACLERANTTVAMTACADAEYRRQDDRLNLEYRRARERLTAPRFATLRQEQRAWLVTRDRACPRGRGSSAALDQLLCRAERTARRADELARYRPTAGRPPANGGLEAWAGRWQGPEGLFLEVEPGRDYDNIRLTVKDTLDDQGVYVGRFDGETIRFERRGRTETIRRGTGAETGFSFLRSRRDCLIVIRNQEGYCRPA